MFKDASIGNYRLKVTSPVIDAADGSVAQAADSVGSPRFTVSTSARTGKPTTSGAYPDMGAFEFVEGATSTIDLAVTGVSALATANAIEGDTVTVQWVVQNIGSGVAAGAWHDAVYLSASPVLAPDAIFLGEVLHGGNLGPGQSYATPATGTFRIPGVVPGNYYFLVRCNSGNEIFEGTNLANNVLASTTPVAIDLPALTLGAPVTSQLATSGASQLYKVTASAGSDLLVTLTGPSGNTNELYVSYGNVPTRQSFDARSVRIGSANQSLSLANTQAGVYYILVYGTTVPSPEHFTLDASTVSFSLTSVTPAQGSNTGQVTLSISGAQFDVNSRPQLVDSSGAIITPLQVYDTDSGLINATFDLTGHPTGPADVQVVNGGVTATLPHGFTLIAGHPGTLVTSVSAPGAVRPGRGFTIYLNYANAGDTDLLAPMLRLSTGGVDVLSLTPDLMSPTTTLDVLAVNPSGPAGILPPGARGQLVLYGRSTQEGTDTLELADDTFGPGPIDWNSLSQSLRPAGYTDAEWNALFGQIHAQIGDQWSGYVAALSRDATLLPANEGLNYSPADVFGLELDRAEAALSPAVSGRLFLGDTNHPLGNVPLTLFDSSQNLAVDTTSLTDGTFLVPNLAPGMYDVTFDGYFPAAPLTVQVGTTSVNLGSVVVSPASTIRGSVILDQLGTPIQNAIVKAVSTDGNFVSALTDANGEYELPSVPAGTYQVTAGGGPFTTVTRDNVVVGAGQTLTNIDFTVQPGASISGRVLGPDQAPRANVKVVASDGIGNETSAVTAADGTFSIASLEPGTYTVVAVAPGFAEGRQDNIAVSLGVATSGITLSLASSGAIQGTVTAQAGGTAVPFAIVILSDATTVVTAGQADINGNYQVSDIPPGTYTATVSANGYLSGTGQVTITAGQTQTLSFTLATAGRLHGTVLDASGHPVPDVLVTAVGTSQGPAQAVSAANGSYELDNLGLDTYNVSIGADGPDPVMSQSVTLSSSSPAAAVNFTLNLAGTITGQVFGPDGTTPLGNVTVGLFQNGQELLTTDTDHAGNYTFLILQPGTYDVAAGASLLSFPVRGNVSVTGGGAPITVNFVAGQSTFEGKLVDTTTGSPIGGATVEVVDPHLGFSLSPPDLTTATDGTFQVNGLAAGTYEVVLQDSVHATVDTQFTVPAQQAGTPVTFSTVPGVSLNGTVSDGHSGQPLNGAVVKIYRTSDGHLLEEAATDASGKFQAAGLAPGTYDVVAVQDGYTQQLFPGTSVGTGDNVLGILLSPSTTQVSGTVTGITSPSGTTVTAVDSSGRFSETVTPDANGNYTLRSLPPGTYTIRSTGPGSTSGPLTVQVSEGQSLTGQNLTPTYVALNTQFNPLATPPPPQAPPGNGLGWLTKAQLDALINQELPPTIPPAAPGCEAYRQRALDYLAVARSTASGVSDAQQAQNPTWLGINADTGLAVAQGIKTLADIASLAYSLKQRIQFVKGLIDNADQFVKNSNLALKSVELWNNLKKVLYENIPGLTTAATELYYNTGQILSDLRSGNAPSGGDMQSTFDALNNLFAAAGQIAVALGRSEALANVAPVLSTLISPATGIASVIDDVITLKKEYDNSQRDILRRLQALNAAQFASGVAALKFQQAYALFLMCNKCGPMSVPPLPVRKGPVRGRQPINNPTGHDPNDLIGPAGYGDQGFVQPATMSYRVDFENDPKKATAAVQVVTATLTLDANLDPGTFAFTGFGFGSFTFSVPAGLSHYQTTLDLRPDGINLLVPVTMDLNQASGVVSVTFASLDPLTRQPPDGVNDGFLPIDNANHDGEGFFTYTVQPKAGLSSGTTITAQASIVFDTNAPLATPTALNTLDVGAPRSTVASLPAQTTTPTFAVSWSGQDDAGGSGIAFYDVYVATDGGAFTPWLTATTQTTANYPGQNGHGYAFYSIATDNVGHRQAPPSAAQASTQVVVTPPASSVKALPAFEPAHFNLTWTGSPGANGAAIAFYDVYVSDNGAAFTPFLTHTTKTSAAFPGVNGHRYGFCSVATDTLGIAQPVPAAAQALTRVDGVAPTSKVKTLPAVSKTTKITLHWSGSDNSGGSGIAFYDVYVSDNGGKFKLILKHTTKTSLVYTGKAGHKYGFYSVATDKVGNRQATPTKAQATTKVQAAGVPADRVFSDETLVAALRERKSS